MKLFILFSPLISISNGLRLRTKEVPAISTEHGPVRSPINREDAGIIDLIAGHCPEQVQVLMDCYVGDEGAMIECMHCARGGIHKDKLDCAVISAKAQSSYSMCTDKCNVACYKQVSSLYHCVEEVACALTEVNMIVDASEHAGGHFLNPYKAAVGSDLSEACTIEDYEAKIRAGERFGEYRRPGGVCTERRGSSECPAPREEGSEYECRCNPLNGCCWCQDIGNCMAGRTGLTKVEKVLGSVYSTSVVQLKDLEVGDRVVGTDENMNHADECEVVSVSSKGNSTVFGNYTENHYILNSGAADITVHGNQGDESTEQVFQILSSCPLVTDESGKRSTFSICGEALYNLDPMPWSVYLKIHSTMFKLVKTSGIRDLSAFHDLSYATQHLPGLCASGMNCATDAGNCIDFEHQMLDFINRELTPSAREKALAAFPNLGDATKVGSVSHLVSMGKSVAIESLE